MKKSLRPTREGQAALAHEIMVALKPVNPPVTQGQQALADAVVRFQEKGSCFGSAR